MKEFSWQSTSVYAAEMDDFFGDCPGGAVNKMSSNFRKDREKVFATDKKLITIARESLLCRK